jgi:ferritin-like metal-binding protein YciE
MSEPRDLFLHELGDVPYAERTLVKTLPKLQEEASDEGSPSGARSISTRPGST